MLMILLSKLQNNRIGTFIILYADDLLLLARSVTALQKLLWACEQEFESIDMAINVKKSSCLRIGARRDKLCSSIHTLNGREFDWVNEVRNLGVHNCAFPPIQMLCRPGQTVLLPSSK